MIEAREMFAFADTTQRMSNFVGFSSSVLKMAAPSWRLCRAAECLIAGNLSISACPGVDYS